MDFIPSRVEHDEEHPPVARKVICVDFDATLFPWGQLDDDSAPLTGAAEAVRAFKDAGYAIVIFTSRLSPTWWTAEGWDHDSAYLHWYSECGKRLTKHGIPWDTITAEKVPAIAYIDDKAIEFTGDNWPSIQDRILGAR